MVTPFDSAFLINASSYSEIRAPGFSISILTKPESSIASAY